jgi:hypothetical protein
MRRQLFIAIAAAAILSACASAKLPAIPPPVDTATSASAPAQPAPTSWYQPFRADGTWEERRFGMGVLKANYPLTDDTVDFKGKLYPKTGSTTDIKGTVKPLNSSLQAVFVTTQIAYFGFGWGEIKADVPNAKTYLKVFGLYEGVRVPITVADFKGPDIQLLLVPGMTMQVLFGSNDPAPGIKMTGLMIGGSLNGVGLGVSVGDWLILEADFWKWGWTYFDMTRDNPDGSTAMYTFSDFAYGWAPVFYARAKF